jgi:hypothetical protein
MIFLLKPFAGLIRILFNLSSLARSAFFLICLWPLSGHSDIFQSKIHKYILSGDSIKPHLLKFDNGRVALIHGKESLNIKSGEWVEVEVDKDNYLVSIYGLNYHETGFVRGDAIYAEFTPTVLSNFKEVYRIFNNMNRKYKKESECYNRAHVWAYEEFKRSGLKSKKIFLFFTDRYIQRFGYKWWFHVSPFVTVKSGSSYIERVLDYEYTRGPRSIKDWSDVFIKSKRDCPTVVKYSDYSLNQQSEDCYLIKTSMYYWQPQDIESFEKNGFQKKSFIQEEIDHAYWQGFSYPL